VSWEEDEVYRKIFGYDLIFLKGGREQSLLFPSHFYKYFDYAQHEKNVPKGRCYKLLVISYQLLIVRLWRSSLRMNLYELFNVPNISADALNDYNIVSF
jgi:hypothetical protein